MKQQFPNEKLDDLIEMPKPSKIETEKLTHWSGYTQQPRQPISPYKNKENIKKDRLILDGIKKTNRFFGEAARYTSLEKEYPSKLPNLSNSRSNKSLEGNSPQIQQRNPDKPNPFKRETELISNKWNHRYNESIVRKSPNEFVINMKKVHKRTNLKSLNFSRDTISDFFDKDMAKIVISQPSESNLNPLFLNTRQFNNKTLEYQNIKADHEANQSRISTKSYGKSSFKTKSKFKNRNNNSTQIHKKNNLDFDQIRRALQNNSSILSNSITLKSNLGSPRGGSTMIIGGNSALNSSVEIDTAPNFTETYDSNTVFPIVNSRYEPENKQFISQYNVKKTYGSKMQPFFHDGSTEKLN